MDGLGVGIVLVLTAFAIERLWDFLITKKNLKEWWEEKRERWHESRVKRRFRKLPEKHQKWLIRTFEQFGNNTFYMPDAAIVKEFFKELQEWNYVKWVTQIVIIPSDGFKYRLTDPGMKQIEKSRPRIGS